MKTIYKFAIKLQDIIDVVEIAMPRNAVVLSVGNQNENLCVWAETNTNDQKIGHIRHFRVAGTGHPLDVGIPLGRFLGSVQFLDGELVFHIYEEKL